MSVVNVNTLVQDPAWKKVSGMKIIRKGKSFKKAYVTFTPTEEDEATQQIQNQQSTEKTNQD